MRVSLFQVFIYSKLVYGLNLNDGISPLCEKLIEFHDVSMKVLIFVSILIAGAIYGVWMSTSLSTSFLDNKVLEIVWTVIPALILVILAVPSLRLLYYMDIPLLSRSGKDSVVKVIGHQWYWSYEYLDPLYNHIPLVYDAYMIPAERLTNGGVRLLETDKPLVLNACMKTLIEGSTTDVIHCWTCPTLGVKIDVVPGRLNVVQLLPTHVGVYYGQCSEICGANHSFMPIEIEVIHNKF